MCGSSIYGLLEGRRPVRSGHFAVNFASISRNVVSSQDIARDALSPAAQARRRFRATNLNLYERELGQWRQVAVEDKRTKVADLPASRLDFACWLETLGRRDPRIVAALAAGEGIGAVAARVHISPARVSQLRRKFEHLWLAFHSDAARGAA